MSENNNSTSESKLTKAKSLDLGNIPHCLSYKFLGDPVDVIPLKLENYSTGEVRLCKVHIAREDGVECSSPPVSTDIGFDLISLTSRRGHFIDKVRPNSKADIAGLKHGDLLLEVNGVTVKSMSHEDLVSLIRQNSVELMIHPDDQEADLELKVVSTNQEEADDESKDKVTFY